jgi:hypothetical protein
MLSLSSCPNVRPDPGFPGFPIELLERYSTGCTCITGAFSSTPRGDSHPTGCRRRPFSEIIVRTQCQRTQTRYPPIAAPECWTTRSNAPCVILLCQQQQTQVLPYSRYGQRINRTLGTLVDQVANIATAVEVYSIGQHVLIK